MRVGFVLPHIGPAAGAESIIQAAKKAEALGYDSLWVTERLLYPTSPQTPYPATPDGSLPEAYRQVFDPLGTLIFVAGHTNRVALGTSVLDLPYYNPVLLARQLTTLDIVSGGRLRVGFGLGWSKDEFDAVGASLKERGARADEFLQVLKAIWTTNPVEFRGQFYQIPRSTIGPKPVQKPHPPIYLAAFVPAALRRAAKYADGWNATGLPLDELREMIYQFREMAKEARRDSAALEVVVRVNLNLTAQPLGGDRWPFTGSQDQVKSDIERLREMEVAEVFFDPTFSPDGKSAQRFMGCMERVRSLS